MNCPNVNNYGNGAQIFARCALGEVTDGVDKSQNYLYVQCEQSGKSDNNFILCICLVLTCLLLPHNWLNSYTRLYTIGMAEKSYVYEIFISWSKVNPIVVVFLKG